MPKTLRITNMFGNETAESVFALGVPNPAVVDFNPPIPDPPLWEVEPQQFNWPDAQGQDDYWHYMSVQAVNDPEGNGEEYYFECIDNDFYDSGWLNATNLSPVPLAVPPVVPGPNEYYVHVGAPNLKLRYRVRTRDQSPNQNTGGWSTVETVP